MWPKQRIAQRYTNSSGLGCFHSAGSFISQGIANIPVAGLLVTFSVITTKYGSAFAHSLPSHLLSRVMGVVVTGMAPIVVHFGGKNKQNGHEQENSARTGPRSSTSSGSDSGRKSADEGPLGPLPSFLPRGIEIPSIGYAHSETTTGPERADSVSLTRYLAISHDLDGNAVHTSFRTAWSSAHIVIPVGMATGFASVWPSDTFLLQVCDFEQTSLQ